MNENRKRLGRLTVEETGQKLELVSVLVGKRTGCSSLTLTRQKTRWIWKE